MRRTRLLGLLVIGIAGCSGAADRRAPAASAAPPPRRVARFVPPPDRVVRSVLLSFESADDLAFLDARRVTVADDPERAGNRVLLISGATTVKLGAVLRGREFPGPWDLIGFRVRGDAPAAATVSLAGAGTGGPAVPFDVAPGEWRTRWFELSTLMADAASRPTSWSSDDLALRLSVAAGATFMLDDLTIAQSRVTVSESRAPQTDERWAVRRVGAEWRASFDDAVVLRLPALPFAEGGYRVAEAGPTRVLFATADESRTLCVDRTGRLIEDGRARVDAAFGPHARAGAENASPAQVEVTGGGRVERSMPGDHDNDGFDETRGCYCLRAAGDRVSFRMARRRATVRWPVVEVAGLPPGAVIVWLDGQVVPWSTRLDDGRVVVELPIELERPVDVQVRVR